MPATRRSALSRLLAGEAELAPFAPVAIPPGRLHGFEAAIASRALGCPDLFLLDCADSASRERIILNLVRAAAERGERFLVISPDPAAGDRLVEALAADRTIRAVRALSDDENPMRPSPAVSRLTSSGAGTNRAEQLRREAAQTVTALEGKLAGLERSREFQTNLASIEGERQSLLADRATCEAELRERHRNEPKEPVGRCREIQAEREAIRVKRAELERIAPPKSGIIAKLFGFAKPAADHSQELKQLTERDATLVAECEVLARQTALESEKRIAEELAARFGKRLAELDGEAARVDAEIRRLHPQAASEDTVENGSPSRTTRLELEREVIVARTRQQELAAAGADLARRLLAETQVVIGTPGCIESDPVFAALGPAPFERLLLDHAEELTESAFDRFAPMAARLILAGDVSPPPPPVVSNGRPARRPNEPSLLSRLARPLDREPWRVEGDRLIVRLVHIAANARAGLVREPLLDHPDVELGVATVGGEPVLAEIAFPAATAILAAKSFLFSQLGEVVLHTCGEPQFQATADGLLATWPHFESGEGEWIDLETDIREKVAGRGQAMFTAAISFNGAAWEEAAAREWLAARTSAPTSRLAILPCDRAAPRPSFVR